MLILPKVLNSAGIAPIKHIHCIYIVPLIRVNFMGDIILTNVNLCLKFLFRLFCKLYALDLVFCASRTFFYLPHRNLNPVYHSEEAEFPAPNKFIIYTEVMKSIPPLTNVQYFAGFLLYVCDLRKTCTNRWE